MCIRRVIKVIQIHNLNYSGQHEFFCSTHLWKFDTQLLTKRKLNSSKFMGDGHGPLSTFSCQHLAGDNSLLRKLTNNVRINSPNRS